MSRLSPINQARWARFRSNRRGYWSLWMFSGAVCPQPGGQPDRQ
jgi:microcin C transport system permease protein